MSVKNLKNHLILITMILYGCHETKKSHKDPKIGEGTVFAEPYDGESCPSSEGQWKSFWKNSFIDLRSSNYDKAKSVIVSENLAKCQNDLAQFPLSTSCVSNMFKFVSSQRQQMRPGYSMGFKLSDLDYYSRLPDQSMLDLPDGL
jgi:hypothetical protein